MGVLGHRLVSQGCLTVSAQANKRLLRPADAYSDWMRKLSRTQKDNGRFLSSFNQRCLRIRSMLRLTMPQAGRRWRPGISWSGCNLKRARQPESLTADRRTSRVSLVPGGVDPIFYFLSRPHTLRLRAMATRRACVPACSIHHDDFPARGHGRPNANCFVGVSLLVLESTSPFAVSGQASAVMGSLSIFPDLALHLE